MACYFSFKMRETDAWQMVRECSDIAHGQCLAYSNECQLVLPVVYECSPRGGEPTEEPPKELSQEVISKHGLCYEIPTLEG